MVIKNELENSAFAELWHVLIEDSVSSSIWADLQ